MESGESTRNFIPGPAASAQFKPKPLSQKFHFINKNICYDLLHKVFEMHPITYNNMAKPNINIVQNCRLVVCVNPEL